MYPYKRIFWQDEVKDQHGNIIQDGTPLSSKNMNNQEEGIFSAAELSAVLAQQVRQHNRVLADLEGEIGEVILTNSQSYPFNNSVKTVALAKKRDTLNYRVTVEVVSVTGGMAGDIEVYDKQLNGFKIAFAGSATSAKVKYYVQGGMYQ